MEVRSNKDRQSDLKIRYTRSVAIESFDKNRLCRQNAAESPITRPFDDDQEEA